MSAAPGPSERVLETDRWIIDRESDGTYTVVDMHGRSVLTGIPTIEDAYAETGHPAPDDTQPEQTP
jgi:hypothetical protein